MWRSALLHETVRLQSFTPNRSLDLAVAQEHNLVAVALMAAAQDLLGTPEGASDASVASLATSNLEFTAVPWLSALRRGLSRLITSTVLTPALLPPTTPEAGAGSEAASMSATLTVEMALQLVRHGDHDVRVGSIKGLRKLLKRRLRFQHQKHEN